MPVVMELQRSAARSRQMTAGAISSSRVAASRPASLAERASRDGRQQASTPAKLARPFLCHSAPGRRLHAERTPWYDGVEVPRVLRGSGQASAWREARRFASHYDQGGRWTKYRPGWTVNEMPSTLSRCRPMDQMCAATIAVLGSDSASVLKGTVRPTSLAAGLPCGHPPPAAAVLVGLHLCRAADLFRDMGTPPRGPAG